MPFSLYERTLIYTNAINSLLNKQPIVKLKEKFAAYDKVTWNTTKSRAYIELIQFICIETEKNPLFLWERYTEFVGRDRTKALGQFFTPLYVAKFALSGLSKESKYIIDPMAGHGTFLLAASQLFPTSKVIGIEIDSLLITTAGLILDNKKSIVHSDVFKWAVTRFNVKDNFTYGAVVGNPPYISYQNLQKIPNFTEEKFTKEFIDYRTFLLDSLNQIAFAKNKENEVILLLKKLSGYSDLSVYAMILAYLISNETGEIAFVTTNHWMEREYGEPLRQFLAKKGVVRGVITHRRGNWFPGAQIPTSVIVYSKGAKSKRQDELGIPYVEITGASNDNLTEFLESVVGKEFWKWLDEVNNSGDYGNLRVTFKNWVKPRRRNNIAEKLPQESRGIRFPSYLEDEAIYSFRQIGWKIHQGLRTGCNEFFYVRKTSTSLDDLYEIKLTRVGKTVQYNLTIPREFTRPAIHKLTYHGPLVIGPKDTNIYVLDFNSGVLPEDMKLVKSFPKVWQERWNVNQLKIFSPNLAKHIRDCGKLKYGGNGASGKPIKELSAVRTNSYVPKSANNSPIPQAPKFWYQLSFQSRHFGALITSRVTSGPLRSYLVCDSGNLVTDANFVTLLPSRAKIEPQTVWIWLNSNTFRLICELNGVPLGGGALKVEASLISKIPIPAKLKGIQKSDVVNITQKLSKSLSDNELIEIGEEIDKLIFGKTESELCARDLVQLLKHRQITASPRTDL